MDILQLSVLGLAVLLLVFLAILLWRSKMAYRAIQKKYQPIEEVGTEVQKQKATLVELEQVRTRLEAEHKGKITTLETEYAQAKELRDKLSKELEGLEETLDLQSAGIYKPHFEFDSSLQFQRAIETNLEKQKALIKDGFAVRFGETWTVSGSATEGKKMQKQYSRLMLRAFNGESDVSIARVRWNNVTTMEARIEKAFEAVNQLGTVLSVSIADSYLVMKLEELRLTHEYQEKLQAEKEEQRRIKEQMREEERVRRELEAAKEEAEDEEKRYQKALDKARSELEQAQGAEVEELNKKMAELELQLKAAQEQKERAISRAQLTKSGHVYIISNIGSFGESVFKIGMTRRLEPLDRIRELSDASVPFGFDIHALAYSEDAPKLEYRLHDHFWQKRVNLVNDRKEFFNITIEELEQFAAKDGLEITITRLAEAKEYRETLALRQGGLQESGASGKLQPPPSMEHPPTN
jgi:predicted RNase H-like nuclease (RuvC/YqgF family)